MLSAFTILPTKADAAVNMPKDTTYIASYNVYQRTVTEKFMYIGID